MKIKVFIERTDEKKSVQAKTPIEALEKLNINPNTVIITRNKEIITEDTKLKKNDYLELLSVISGG